MEDVTVSASVERIVDVPLVECTRGDIVESLHYGAFTVVGPDGTTLLAAGDQRRPVYARSSLKPLQVAAMLRLGLELPEDLLALAASSHSGSAIHQDGARRILQLYGRDVDDLRNTPDLPYGDVEKTAWLRERRGPTSLAQNCSGKHAAMVATCVVKGWTTGDYLAPDHPLQRHIVSTLDELTGERAGAVSVDGCGAPVFAYTLPALARSYSVLGAAAPESSEGRVVAAMRRFPELVSGEGRDVAGLMRALPDVFAKDGAEGVHLAGRSDGTGLAIKISDGGDRARMPITVALLRAVGSDSPLLDGLSAPVLGGGRPVGELRAVPVERFDVPVTVPETTPEGMP